MGRVDAFQREAHVVLGRHEESVSRVIKLKSSYERLSSLSLEQDDLLRQALRCVEHELFRAAHVLAWAALIDYVEKRLDLTEVFRVRPKWKVVKSIEELREHVPEAQLIDVARDTGLLRKNEQKAFHGLLNKRNECAHPSSSYPDLNQTLGYISEILTRLEELENRLRHDPAQGSDG